MGDVNLVLVFGIGSGSGSWNSAWTLAGAQNLCKIMSKSLNINEKSLKIYAKSMKIYAESMTNH